MKQTVGKIGVTFELKVTVRQGKYNCTADLLFDRLGNVLLVLC